MIAFNKEPIQLGHKWFSILPTFLVLWLLLLPLISPPFYETIDHYLQLSIETNHAGKLILAAMILVLVYTFSEIIIFMLAFSIGQAIFYQTNKWISILTTGIIIFLSYVFLMIVMDYRFALSTPFIVTVVYMVVLLRLNIYKVKFKFQSLFLFQLLLLTQWLEINPAMHQYGFGKSDTAKDIILASYDMNVSHILQLISLLVTIPFFFSTVVTYILIKVNILRVQELEKSKIREKELQDMRIEALESRANEELNHLVHDLKTPLTTISGLNSLLEMSSDSEKEKEYSRRIEQSVGQLNTMISEILSEDVKKPIKIDRLLNYTRANLIEEKLQAKIEFINHDPDEVIYVNRIRLTRSLINLLENALHATEDMPNGKIRVQLQMANAYTQGEKVEGVLIQISDNGNGIAAKELERIWDIKYSTKGSSGLGLPFVRKVVKSHGGWIKAENRVGRETMFTLFIPRGGV